MSPEFFGCLAEVSSLFHSFFPPLKMLFFLVRLLETMVPRSRGRNWSQLMGVLVHTRKNNNSIGARSALGRDLLINFWEGIVSNI